MKTEDNIPVAMVVCMSIRRFFSRSCGNELTAEVSLAVLSDIIEKATSLSLSMPCYNTILLYIYNLMHTMLIIYEESMTIVHE